eukprot:Pompholyxophrys_sp_v1_NODE_184_length_1311_cov_1.266720.p1 type:complete len:107 gc:universal NODE_184_length_1311_cov_1.266720:439-759(+)
MGLGKDLTSFQKGQIFAEWRCATPIAVVAEIMQLSRETVRKYYRLLDSGLPIESSQRELCGRHLKTTLQEDEQILAASERNHFLTSPELKNELDLQVHFSTLLLAD